MGKSVAALPVCWKLVPPVMYTFEFASTAMPPPRVTSVDRIAPAKVCGIRQAGKSNQRGVNLADKKLARAQRSDLNRAQRGGKRMGRVGLVGGSGGANDVNLVSGVERQLRAPILFRYPKDKSSKEASLPTDPVR